VIARNTAFTFKNKAVPVTEISQALGVRYVLEGSVQRDQNRVRVNAQLIDGGSGAHLWADRFEEEVADLFKLQDRVVAQLANALGYELVKAEASRGAHSANPDAIDLTMRGWAILNQPQLVSDLTSVAKARDLFEQALKLDPRNVDALVGAAAAERWDFVDHGLDAKPGQIATIDDWLAAAISIDPANARAYALRSAFDFLTHRSKEALEAAQNAVRLNPSYATAYANLGQDEMKPAEFPQAIANIDYAMKLSPRDPDMGRWRFNKARVLNYMGRYPDAIREAQAALDNGFSIWAVYLQLAVAHAYMDQQSQAQAAVAEARKRLPQLTIKWYRGRIDVPESFSEGLRKAGLPED
jgi:adenylate cyclase